MYETTDGEAVDRCTPIVYGLMKSLRTLLSVLALGSVALVGGGAGCSMLTNADDDSSPNVEQTIAEVDSLHAPDQIAASDTLSLRMTGTVGPNGCYGFAGFDAERSAHRVRVTPVVARRTGEGIVCTQAIVPLDETFTAAPPFTEGTLKVVVPQADRPDVTATIEVTGDAE